MQQAPVAAATLDEAAWLAALQDERVDVVGRTLDEQLAAYGVSDAARGRLRELLEGVWWSSEDEAGDRAAVVRAVREAIAKTSGTETEPLLALYVRVVCELAWDLTWDHDPLLEVLDAAAASWAAHPPAAGSAAALAVRTLESLRQELLVESACSTGDLATLAIVCSHAGEALAADIAAADDLPSSALRDHMRHVLVERATYIEAVCAGAAAALDYLSGAIDDLDAAIVELRAAEALVTDDHPTRSEIRAHRVAIERLAAARTEDWLRIDEGSIVCVFPFGLRHADQAQVVTAVKRHAGAWSLAGHALANEPTGLLLVDDVWRGDDPLKRRFEGTQLDLPDLVLGGRAGEEITARVTITISQLGNHYVRVAIPLAAALPHDVAARVWLAAPEYGDLAELGQGIALDRADDEPRDDDGRQWPRMSALVTDVLDDLVAELGRSGLPDAALSFRPGMYHVVTTISEASVLPGGRADLAYRLEDAERIPQLFGSQPVCHPVPAGIGSLATWAMYEAPLGTRIACAGLTGEYILASENHTLIASFASPDYMVATVGQAVEFVASLEGMFAAWQDELTDFYLGVAGHLQRLDPAGGTTAPDEHAEDDTLAAILADLEQRHMRLRQFLTSARVTLLFVASPALVTSPVMRTTIDELLAANRTWGQRTEFTDVAGQALADRLTDLIETWSRRRAEERAKRDEENQRRNRVRIDTMIAVLTGIGISGVLAMVQTGYGVARVGSIVLVVLVLALAAVVGYASYRWSRRLDRADTAAPPEPPRERRER